VLGRAGDLELDPDGLGHGASRPVLSLVFSASSRNRVAASPQTSSRYSRTAAMPSSSR
jgi:hypothetical protein